MTIWCARVAGFLAFYNSEFFRFAHGAHHRFTQIPGKDPELNDPKPHTHFEYILEITGYFWWKGQIQVHYDILTGNLDKFEFIPPNSQRRIIQHGRIQFLLYALLLFLSSAVAYLGWVPTNVFLTLWLLPLAIGQPFLRMILLSDHTACEYGSNYLTNTRTTYTNLFVRYLMWEMPFHSEHHRYPGIPFHALSEVHSHLKPHLKYVVRGGFLAAQKQIVSGYMRDKAP